jgi:hypothetical protein
MDEPREDFPVSETSTWLAGGIVLATSLVMLLSVVFVMTEVPKPLFGRIVGIIFAVNGLALWLGAPWAVRRYLALGWFSLSQARNWVWAYRVFAALWIALTVAMAAGLIRMAD